ncbi:MAG TPA: hypothetical protein VJU78_08130 [Chitinophagaceae bacterium]|nr:hypothetical protein [Chitinophagaceae bacterium]
MLTLQVEHEVPNYDGWKKALDSDPINRKQSGVKRYRIYKLFNDAKSVIVELDFDDINHLHTTLQALKIYGIKFTVPLCPIQKPG